MISSERTVGGGGEEKYEVGIIRKIIWVGKPGTFRDKGSSIKRLNNIFF